MRYLFGSESTLFVNADEMIQLPPGWKLFQTGSVVLVITAACLPDDSPSLFFTSTRGHRIMQWGCRETG